MRLRTGDSIKAQNPRLQISKIATKRLGIGVRKSFQNWISASERAKKLRRLGYQVSVPPPHLGRPQLIVITPPTAAGRAAVRR